MCWQVDTFLPTVATEVPKRPGEGSVNIRYVPTEDRSGFRAVLYRLNDKNEEQDFKLDDTDGYSVPRSLGLSVYAATTQLSLWEGAEPSPAPPASSD